MTFTPLTPVGFITMLFFFIHPVIAQVPFSPMTFDPAVWLDANDESTLILQNNFVTSWLDKSGNNLNANAITVPQRPIYLPSEKGIYFQGDDDVLTGGYVPHGSDSTITVFVVASLDPGVLASSSTLLMQGEGSNLPYHIRYRKAKEQIDINRNSLSKKAIHDKHIVGFSYKDQYTTTFYNGEWVSPRFAAYYADDEPLLIGARLDDADLLDYFKGIVHEVIIYQKALSSCEIDQVLGYLAHKWNLTDDMDARHPFKTSEIGLCRDAQFSIPENSPAGTTVGTLQAYHLQGDETVSYTGWRVEDPGLAGDFFELDSDSGILSVNTGADLDFEQFSSYNMAVSVKANGQRIYGGVTILLQNAADGDSPKQHSELWGEDGEKWDPRGRLPDCSFAGYEAGEVTSYSYPTTTLNVLDFGAIPNDTLDDSGSVQAAINSTSAAVIYFPPGIYYIDNIVQINKSNIVLIGAGQDLTTIYFKYSASDILPPSSSYGSGSKGFFLNFEGTFSKSNRQRILQETRRGDKSITVQNGAAYSVGQLVRIFFSGGSSDTPPINPIDGSLWNHLHHDQNIPTCPGSSLTGSSELFLFHTIERIDRNVITLKEPLKLELRQVWEPYIEIPTGIITRCGIEGFTLEHKYIPAPVHLNEPGYNAVHFKLSNNCWAKDITIKHADNGIAINRSVFNEVKNITFTGRSGHHGISVTASSNCLVNLVSIQNTESQWSHSVTLQGKSNGIVISNVTGNHAIRVDFHKDAPFDCLFTKVNSAWNFESGGGSCDGEHSGARSTFWNMHGKATYPEWDHIQTNIISDLAIPEQYHLHRAWREKIPNLIPDNLHNAQFNYRMNYEPDLIFDSAYASSYGNRSNWIERDPSRWIVKQEDGEWVYAMSFQDAPALSGNRPGEYSIYEETFVADMQVTANVRSLENTEIDEATELVLICNFQNDDNYVYALISSDPTESGIYLVLNGTSSLLKSVNLSLNPNGSFESYTFERKLNILLLYKNNQLIDLVSNISFIGGKAGIGIYDSTLGFDDIIVSESYVPLPVDWLDFSVVPVDNTFALVKWSTNSEVNSAYFVVERSWNGKHWTEVSRKEAASDASIVSRYEYLDKDALKGQSYYRIQQVDWDGARSYSTIEPLFLGIDAEAALKLYPNPATDELVLVLENAQTNSVLLQVYHGSGLRVIHIPDFDIQQTLSLVDLPAGLYYCQLITEDNQVYIRKFLKQAKTQ
jgi:Pectate lyase superfamily protein/Secretion system C-terminal sorting domain/Cadherin domain